MTVARSATFAADVHAPANARRFASALLRGGVAASALSDVSVIVSELVTNSVRAGATTVDISIARDEGHVRIEVLDSAPGWPRARDVDAEATSGRGLQIVLALARDWGVEPREPGKLVWAVVPAERPATPPAARPAS